MFWWPFGLAFAGAWIILTVILLAFWIWMVVDCAQRNFKENNEKIIWLIVIVLGGWIGALVYYLVIRMSNPLGVSGQKSRKK